MSVFNNPSNYPPGVSGNEPEIQGFDDEPDFEDQFTINCRKVLAAIDDPNATIESVRAVVKEVFPF